MSRDLTGLYTLPSVINPVQPGTIIAVEWANPTLTDIAVAISDSLSRSGKGGMGAPLDMGGYRIISIGFATAPTDAPQAVQVRDQSFRWLNPVASDASGNNYTGTALLTALPVNGSAFQFLADRNNTGAMTLTVNGSAALPVLIHGAPTPPGLVLAGAVLEVVYVNLTYRLVSVSAGGGMISQVQSADPSMLAVANDTGTGIATLTPRSNISLGMVKLDGSAKVPVSQLPFTTLQFVGIWNAAPGTNPPTTGRANGDYFVVTVAGSLTIYRDSGGNVYTPQVTAVAVGAAIIYNAAGTVNQPTGWYYDPSAAAAAVASTTSMNPTPHVATTDVQAWMDVIDPAVVGKLDKIGGTMSGPIIQPALPSGANELANKLYVDNKTAALVGVLSFNSRTGSVVLTSSDVTGALGYSPFPTTGGAITGNVTITENLTVAKGITAAYFVPTYFINDTAPTSLVIDATNGQSQRIGLTGPTIITAINNIPQGSILRLLIHGTAHSLIWPAAVVWPLGILPSFAAGPRKVAIVVLESLSGPTGDLLASATIY